MERFEEAIKDFNDSIRRNTVHLQNDENKFMSFYNKGTCLRKIQQFDKSIEALKAAIEIKSDDSAAHNNLGLSFFERAREAVSAQEQKSVEQEEILNQSDLQDAINEFAKAIQHLQLERQQQLSVEIQHQAADYYSNKGLAHYHSQEGELGEALDHLDQAISYNGAEPIYYLHRGNIYLEMKKYDEAIEDYQRAIKIEPNNPRFLHSMGLAYEILGDKSNAIKFYEESLELDDNYFASRFHLGKQYHKNQEFNKALQCFTRVLQVFVNSKDTFMHRGKVYQDMGNHQFAIQDFNSAIEIDPCSWSYFHRGVSKLKSRNIKDAEADFKKALDIEQEKHIPENDRNPGIYDGLGSCYHIVQDYQQAMHYFDTAVERDPKNILFLMNRSQCFFDQSLFQEAIDDLSTALGTEGNDSHPQLLYKLGLAFFAFDKYRRCIRTMKRAIKAGPYLTYEADIYYHTGLAFCRLERFEESIFPFSKAISLIPNDIRYIHERAKALQMIDQHQMAIDNFSDVIKKNPKNAHAYFRRAFSLKALGKYEPAALDFEKAKALDPLNPKLVVNYKQLKGVSCIVLCRPGEEKVYN